MKDDLEHGLTRLGDAATGTTLQVLLRSFRLVRLVAGLELVVDIDDDLPVLRDGAERREVAKRLDPEEGRRFESALAKLGREAPGTTLEVAFERFAFRHASAGVLPLLGPERRPLLFHRDIHPVGWNVANGGSSSRAELFGIETLMRREALEEILFLDPKRGLLRGLEGAEQVGEARTAMKLWRQRLGAGLGTPLEHRYLRGPDRIRLRDRGDEILTAGVKLCFDLPAFGIELIRFLEIDDQAALHPLDGELAGGRLLDRPVGLFADLAGLRRGRPDRIYRGGRLQSSRLVPAAPLCPVTAAMLGGPEAPARAD